MQKQPLLIEQFPEQQILREDDYLLFSSAYFQIHPRNFQFNNYDHGTPALKHQYHITKPLFKYFNKRHFLFSRFQEGVAIDEESWYSVIPETVSHYLKKRFQQTGVKKIFEPFSGVGGIAIHLCDSFEQYIVNDIDSKKLKMLKHNMRVYEKSINKLKFINSDFLLVEPFQTDALIICPPWGGINTQEYAIVDPDLIMKPKLTDILLHAQRFSTQIMLQMPKQTNIGKIIRIFNKVGLSPIFTIEKIMTSGKCSQLFFYLGTQNFIQIEKCQLYNSIYRDMKIEGKERRKKFKNIVKDNPGQALREVYKSLYPNKRISLVESQKESEG